MSEDFYPELPEGAVFAFEIILRNVQQDPEYLEFSPYSAEDRAFFTRFSGISRISSEIDEEIPEGEDKWARLERESRSLFEGLTQAGQDLNVGDNAEKMAYFRTATQLLDKIVGIQERVYNLKQVHQFHQAVLTLMEDILSPDQRTVVLNRLKELT